MSSQKDLTGNRYGRWTVVKKTRIIPRKDYAEAVWECKCDCGTVREVRSRLLLHKTSNSRSCGCVRAEKQRENPTRLRHGHSKRNPMYHVWKKMRQRCRNPNDEKYPRYGGRGIKVCDRWDVFENFLEDMGPTYKPGLTIDRKNNDGNYEPDNCRWVPLLVQANNTSAVLRNIVILPSMEWTSTEWRDWRNSPKIQDFVEKELTGLIQPGQQAHYYQDVPGHGVAFELR